MNAGEREKLYAAQVGADALARQRRATAPKCKSCLRPMRWVTVSTTNRKMPVDYDPHEDGNVVVHANDRADVYRDVTMNDRALYKLRAGAFGLVVVEYANLFTIPYVPLPRSETQRVFEFVQNASAEISGNFVRQIFGEHIGIVREAHVTATAREPSPKELREKKTLEARRSAQPFEWASHVYVTVGGEVRWRCCGNLFDDDHSPYCQNPETGMGSPGWGY